MPRKIQVVSRRSLAGRLRELRTLRQEQERLKSLSAEVQDAAVTMLSAIDPEGVGYQYTDSDPDGKIYAFVQQNDGPTVWDEEALVAWLHENGRWGECSTQVLDLNKVESLIKDAATSPATKRTLLGFATKSTPPKPFIRFDRKSKK